MAATGTVPAWAARAWEAWALALCRCVRAAWPVADEGAAAGPVADEEGAGAVWWVAGDEAAAGPAVDEEGERALWPVADNEDAAGPEADEEDARGNRKTPQNTRDSPMGFVESSVVWETIWKS